MTLPNDFTHEPAEWPLVSTRQGPDLLLFRARWDVMTNPRNQRSFDRLVLETRDWVNVVAKTAEGEFILVRQFRFGTREVTTEIPGGVIDPGEEHAQTAPRELREETGYTSTKWTYLGSVRPNPAFHDNRCHHWLAEDCVRTEDTLDLDEGEDIQIVLWSEEKVRTAVQDGEMDHCLVQTALSRVLDLRISIS